MPRGGGIIGGRGGLRLFYCVRVLRCTRRLISFMSGYSYPPTIV
jgi:hypothetical protein